MITKLKQDNIKNTLIHFSNPLLTNIYTQNIPSYCLMASMIIKKCFLLPTLTTLLYPCHHKSDQVNLEGYKPNTVCSILPLLAESLLLQTKTMNLTKALKQVFSTWHNPCSTAKSNGQNLKNEK